MPIVEDSISIEGPRESPLDSRHAGDKMSAMELSLETVLQVVIGLGLLNVWLLRARSSTAYRGGDSKSLREEFAAYGLPNWFFYLTGVLKVGSALALLVGLALPELVFPAALVVVGLMLGALAMHAKVKDAPLKSLPALLMLALSATLCWLTRP